VNAPVSLDLELLRFAGWLPYYEEVEVRPLITPMEAMRRLAS